MEQITKNLNRPFEQIDLGNNEFKIVLAAQKVANTAEQTEQALEVMQIGKSYNITVKKWMTQKATPTFNFMKQFNKDIPMPFVTMSGIVLKETTGMYFMELSAKLNNKATHCIRCGRALTHPVSKLYGLGPECGSHAHINPYETEEELLANLEHIKKLIENIKWSGWVIKSSIKEWEEV